VVLQELGSLLRSNSRAGDVPCRYGGEEFVLLLPATALSDARKRADELRETIGTLHVAYRGQLLGSVRCSMGVAAFPTHGMTGETILRAADAALYRAKDSGRDQVMVADAGGISAGPSG
jgi:diguanylate cyclase (GGDEF)-like protein